MDEINPSKNGDYPLLNDCRKTYEEVIRYYTGCAAPTKYTPEGQPGYLPLSRVTAWLASQPFADQLSLAGALGLTHIFHAEDMLMENGTVTYGYDDYETRLYYITMRGPVGVFPYRIKAVNCSHLHFEEQFRIAVSWLLTYK